MAYGYSYTCACGVTVNAASDKGLETILERHYRNSQIHKRKMPR
jgi:hypothetical protein